MPESAPLTLAPDPVREGPPAARLTAAVAGVGMAVPERALASDELERSMGLASGWIESRTGVRERRIAAPEQTLVDLAEAASLEALESAGIRPDEPVDLVLLATVTADRRMPNAAPLLAERLGARAAGAGAIDLGAACTGFLSGLALAAAAVESGRARAVLVVGADRLSGFTDFGDRRTGGLFGDGAGAAVIAAASDGGSIGQSVLGSDGASAELITLEQDDGAKIRMNGHDTFREAVDRLSESALRALERTGWRVADVDLFVFHQANGRILAAVGERLGIEPSRVADYVAPYGNTSSATIPIALSRAVAERRLAPGSKLLLGAFGAGTTWGAATLVWEGAGQDER